MPLLPSFQTARTGRLSSALFGIAVSLYAAVPASAAAPAPKGGPVLQLGLFQKEGEAWWAWQQIQRRGPDIARSLTPTVVTLDSKRQGGGVALRASMTADGNAAVLCRRIVSAGFGCVLLDKDAAASAAAPAPPAAAPAPPPPRPATAGTRTEVVAAPKPAPAQTQTAQTQAAPAQVASVPAAPAPAVLPEAAQAAQASQSNPMEGIVFYNDEYATTMVEIEKRARRRGRLGSVVPDTDMDIMPAVLTKRGWNLCALTFDDGPHRTVTRQILDILNQEKIRATYFPVGNAASKHGDVIRDFVAAGHEIGNHSFTHSDLRSMPSEAQRFEIAETNRILRSFGANPVLFRPPYGRYTLELLANTRKEHMSPVLWNVDTRDWQVRDPDKIVQHVKTDAGTGSVILLHSTYPSTATALPRVIATLRAKGCEFVTLSEWIASMRNLAAPQLVNAAEPVISARATIGAAPH
ncbi:polysaccharide deacetylase family protein [Azospirillum sp. sgz301742]